MFIGSLFHQRSGVSAKLSFTRLGSANTVSMSDGTVLPGKIPFDQSPFGKGETVSWKWDVFLLTGLDITIHFSSRCFVDTLLLELDGESAVKSAELLFEDCGEFRTGAALKGADTYTGALRLTAGVTTDTVIVRLRTCLSDVIIRHFDLTGGVFDEPCVYPLPDSLETTGGSKILLSSLNGADDDGSADAAFAKDLYLEKLNERGVRLSGSSAFRSDDNHDAIRFCVNASLGDEEYTIETDVDGYIIGASSRSGFVYAAETLLQLTGGGYLPQVKLHDKPFQMLRGYHMGIPMRSRIPFIKRLIKYVLVPMKYNTIFLELAGGMHYDSHPEINDMWVKIHDKMNAGEWPKCGHIEYTGDGDVLEKAEVRDLVCFAASYGIEIIPEVQSLSHVQYLTKAHPEIAELAEAKEKPLSEDLRLADIPTNDFYPDAYCPCNEKSYEILFDILDEVIEVFKPKKFVHMGHDELYTHNACPICKDKTPAEVVAADINRIHAHLAEQGLRMIVWGDMFNTINNYATPDIIDRVPKDIVLLDFIWYFRFGEDTEKRLLDHGYQVAVGNLYSSHFPRYETRIRREGMIGGQVSAWVKADEKILSYEGKIYDLMFTANMLWSDKYDSRAFFTYAHYLAGLLPEIRSRAGYDAGHQLPSSSGTFRPIPLKGTAGVPLLLLSAIPSGDITLQGIDFHIGGVDAAAAENGIGKMPSGFTENIGHMADSLILLLAAGNAVMRAAWKTMTKIADMTVAYEDGDQETVDFEYGYNIYDVNERYGKPLEGSYYRHEGYSGTYAIDDSYAGKKPDGSDLSLRAWEWVNPKPGKKIRSVTIKATDHADAPTYLFALTSVKSKS
ncbi:MAG: family 20 glycosylhydrolase [Clostridiaceae bacterium]|nr:family 20 glycosylhydrolase [Clostridiaceae bacterium]